jgi:hypothetical protein
MSLAGCYLATKNVSHSSAAIDSIPDIAELMSIRSPGIVAALADPLASTNDS